MNASANNTFIVKDEFELIKSATDYSLKRAENGWISGLFYHCELTSVFQPIFSISQGKTMGHAAYIRSKANNDVALWPWQVFHWHQRMINWLIWIVYAVQFTP